MDIKEMKCLEGTEEFRNNLEEFGRNLVFCFSKSLSQAGEAWKGCQGPCQEPARLEQIAQGLIRWSFVCLQNQRPHNLSEQPVPVLAHGHLGVHQDSQYLL